jgi:hypothetical protein
MSVATMTLLSQITPDPLTISRSKSTTFSPRPVVSQFTRADRQDFPGHVDEILRGKNSGNRDGLKESACECYEVIREHVLPNWILAMPLPT